MMKSNELITMVRKEFTGLTNLPVDGITGLSKDDETYVVSLEALERKAIPDSMDVLGLYEVRLDNAGNFLTFERKKLRKRADTTES
ncbi:MAG: gas vesicle protein [Chloroflexi bacterium]|nr:gas vesicle protein [Chloroflexota bacterium]